MAAIRLRCIKDFRLSASSSQGLMSGYISQTFDVRAIDDMAEKLIAGGYLQVLAVDDSDQPVEGSEPSSKESDVDLTVPQPDEPIAHPIMDIVENICRYPDCEAVLKNRIGRDAHEREKHPQFTPE